MRLCRQFPPLVWGNLIARARASGMLASGMLAAGKLGSNKGLIALTVISLLLALCLLPLPLTAQPQFKMRPATAVGYSLQANSKSVEFGVNSWEYLFRADGNRFGVLGLQYNLESAGSALALALPEIGFWGQQNVRGFAEELNKPVVVLSRVPRFLEPDVSERGFLFSDNRIYQWPPSEGVLCISPQGGATWVPAQSFEPGEIQLQTGERIPLNRLNSRPSAGEVSLLSGKITLRPAVKNWWPEGALACILTPQPQLQPAGRMHAGLQAEQLPHTALWRSNDSADYIPLIPQRVRPLQELTLRNHEYALVYVPENNPELHQQLTASQTLRITIPLPQNVQFSTLAVQLGETLRENGAWKSAVRTTSPRGVFCLNETSTEFIFLDLGETSERLPWHLFQEFAEKQAFTTVVGLSETEKPFFLPQDDRGLSAAGEAYTVLYPKTKRQTQNVAGRENVQQLAISFATASNNDQVQGGASALFDGSFKPQRPLLNYWSAPVLAAANRGAQTAELPWVEVRLQAPAYVQLLDLYHAESVGFSPSFNLKSFRIMAKLSQADAWTQLITAQSEKPQAQQRVLIDSTGPWEYLRLEVVEPAFQPTVQSARLAEIVIWGNPVEMPSSAGSSTAAPERAFGQRNLN